MESGDQDKLYDYGVLFVHGIGSQKRGETLVQCAEALIKGVHRRLADRPCPPSEAPVVEDAKLTGGSGEPAHAHVKIQYFSTDSDSMVDSHWLMAESLWADKFVTPSYGDIASWAGRTLPWTLVSHVDRGFRRLGYRYIRASLDKPSARTWLELGLDALGAAIVLFMGLLAIPLLLLFIGLMLVIGAIPNATIRRWLAGVQRTMVSLIGDSFIFTDQKLGRGAILSSVRSDLEWLSSRCKRIAIVAHSQGGAVAHAVVKDALLRSDDLFVTYGSGLRKLAEISRIKGLRRQGAAHCAIWRAIGAVVVSASALLWLTSFAPLANRAYGLAEAIVSVFVSLSVGVIVLAWQFRTYHREDERLRSIRTENPAPRGVGVALGIYLVCMALLPLLFLQTPWVQAPMAHAIAHWAIAAGLAIAFLSLLSWRQMAGLSALPSRQAVIDEELYDKHYDLSTAMDWLDFPAASDPVSNGGLLDSARYRPKQVLSKTVHNFNSAIRDHTTYWSNLDGFVLEVADRMILSALRFVGAPKTGDWAFSDARRVRVEWLASTRRVLIGLCVAAFFAAILLPSSWIDHLVAVLHAGSTDGSCGISSVFSNLLGGYESGRFGAVISCLSNGNERPESIGTTAVASLLLFGLLYAAVLVPWTIWNAIDGNASKPGKEGGRWFWSFVTIFAISSLLVVWGVTETFLVATGLTIALMVALIYWRMPRLFSPKKSSSVRATDKFSKENLTPLEEVQRGEQLLSESVVLAIACFRSAMSKAAEVNDEYALGRAAKALAEHSIEARSDPDLVLLVAKEWDDIPLDELANKYIDNGELGKAEDLLTRAVNQGATRFNWQLGQLLERVSVPRAIRAYEAGVTAKHTFCASALASLHRRQYWNSRDVSHLRAEIQAHKAEVRLGGVGSILSLVHALKKLGNTDEALEFAYQGAKLGERGCYLAAGQIELEVKGNVENARRAFLSELSRHRKFTGGQVHERLGFVSNLQGNHVAAQHHYSCGMTLNNEKSMYALGNLLVEHQANLDPKWRAIAIDAFTAAVNLGNKDSLAPLYSILVSDRQYQKALAFRKDYDLFEPDVTRELARRLSSSDRATSQWLLKELFLAGDVDSMSIIGPTVKRDEEIVELIREFARMHPDRLWSLAHHFNSVGLLDYARFVESCRL